MNPTLRGFKGASVKCAAAIVSTIAVVGASIPVAMASPHASSGNIPQVADNSASLGKHSDRELLYFLLAGQGPIADENPDLLKAMNFDPDKPHTDEVALDQVIDEYLAYSGSFPSIKRSITSGNPAEVERGLKRFSDDFVTYLKQSEYLVSMEEQPGVTPYGFCGGTACGAVVVLVLANGVVYANVAIATMALAAGAIVTLAVYLEDDEVSPNPMSEFERQEITARLARALA